MRRGAEETVRDAAAAGMADGQPSGIAYNKEAIGGRRVRWEVVISALTALLSVALTAGNLYMMWHYQVPVFAATQKASDVDVHLKGINVAFEKMRIIQHITPKPELGMAPLVLTTTWKDAQFGWDVRNEGEFSFIGQDMKIFFSTSLLDWNDLEKMRPDYEITFQGRVAVVSPKSHVPVTAYVHWQNGWPKKWFYWYIFLVVQTDPDITRALNDETDGAFKELIEERKIFHLSAFGRVGNWKPWGARNEEMTFGNGSFH